MISVDVFTIEGKSQNFLLDPLKYIGDIKAHIQKTHRHLNKKQDIRLLYKGIKLDDDQSLDFYNITNNSSIQTIYETNPISIRLSESMPTGHVSIFENYAPSPLDYRHSRSNSPENSQANFLLSKMQKITDTMDNILTRMERIEERLDQISPDI